MTTASDSKADESVIDDAKDADIIIVSEQADGSLAVDSTLTAAEAADLEADLNDEEQSTGGDESWQTQTTTQILNIQEQVAALISAQASQTTLAAQAISAQTETQNQANQVIQLMTHQIAELAEAVGSMKTPQSGSILSQENVVKEGEAMTGQALEQVTEKRPRKKPEKWM